MAVPSGPLGFFQVMTKRPASPAFAPELAVTTICRPAATVAVIEEPEICVTLAAPGAQKDALWFGDESEMLPPFGPVVRAVPEHNGSDPPAAACTVDEVDAAGVVDVVEDAPPPVSL